MRRNIDGRLRRLERTVGARMAWSDRWQEHLRTQEAFDRKWDALCADCEPMPHTLEEHHAAMVQIKRALKG